MDPNLKGEIIPEPVPQNLQERLFLELKNEEIASSDIPKDAKEKVVIKDLYSNIKVVNFALKFQKIDCRRRNTPKNKVKMNMKVVLDSRFKTNIVTLIEDSSSKEDPQTNNLEYIVDQTL